MFKLISLSANKASFHSVSFNSGLNVVVGEQTTKSLGKTTNGVGKSLLIKIIDFCLGSEKNDLFCEKLPDWEFMLEVSINNENHIIKRSTNDHKHITFDDETLTVRKFCPLMKDLVSIDDSFSFREILSRFIRRRKKAYNSFLKSVIEEKDVKTQLILCYLLGIDYSYCVTKAQLKTDLDNLNSFSKTAFERSALGKVLGINPDNVELELSEIDENIEKQEKEIAECKYAENYSEMQKKCNSIAAKMSQMNNKKYYYQNRVSLIEDALNKEINVTLSSVRDMYNSVGVIWGNELQKTVQEVEKFHDNLIQNRRKELNKNLLECKLAIDDINKELLSLNAEYNELLGFLKTHVAIEQFANQLRYIDSLKNKKKELTRLEAVKKETANKIETTKQEIAQQNIEAQKYLDDNSNLFHLLNKQFSKIAKQFYPDKKSGLLVKNNTGKGLNRFDIDARITSDASDGISSIIIFCFDLVLLSQKVTDFGFIYHDSLLLSDVDSRQREKLFRIIDKEFRDYQYIINLNSDQFETFSEDVKSMVESKTILQLSDKDVASKLLGIEVDFGKDDF